jgi:methyl-accepting chemotaxis protein
MNFVVTNLISIIAASIAAAILLNRFFRNSVFVRIGLIWLFNLLFIMLMVGIKYKFFDGNTLINAIITCVNIIVSVFCFYFASIIVVKPLTEAINNLKKLAEGNLNITTDKKLINVSNDLGNLHLSTEKLKNNLTGIVKDINQNIGLLTRSGKKLSEVSQQLSQEAMTQASSAEEVSASMEEMASNIMQNTENAQQANLNAQETEQGVIDGVNAADEAQVYSTQISEKISIIREIAFQTNILALNAAVEASHAGEHGKGFAVVATEVRKLAERSAAAAREIEDLVSHLQNASDTAGIKLNAVIPKVKNNLKLVNQIALASAEQTSGATEINNSIHQLNEITQHNLAASEEMAAGSEELNKQAQQLKSIIGYFKM